MQVTGKKSAAGAVCSWSPPTLPVNTGPHTAIHGCAGAGSASSAHDAAVPRVHCLHLFKFDKAANYSDPKRAVSADDAMLL